MDLIQSIEGSIKNAEVYLNPKDFNAIFEYNKKNKIDLSFKIISDEKLQRGDLRIKSNAIEVSELVTNKIKFSNPDSIDSDLEKLKDANNKTESS